MYDIWALEYKGGLVLGCKAKAVMPPAKAARAKLCKSSLVSKPGSPAFTFKSQKPGAKIAPAASIISALSGTDKSLPMAAIFPSTTNTSVFG